MENKYNGIEQKLKEFLMFCSTNNLNYTLTYGSEQNLINFDGNSVTVDIYNVEDENLNDYLELKLTEIKEKHGKKEK